MWYNGKNRTQGSHTGFESGSATFELGNLELA